MLTVTPAVVSAALLALLPQPSRSDSRSYHVIARCGHRQDAILVEPSPSGGTLLFGSDWGGWTYIRDRGDHPDGAVFVGGSHRIVRVAECASRALGWHVVQLTA